MNIFYLSECPEEAARSQCDKHVVKMILETAQLLSTAHRVLDGDAWADEIGMYRRTHVNHPSAAWVRENRQNYRWTYRHLVYLCDEYTVRYGRVHKTAGILTAFLLAPRNIPRGEFTPPPQCMPDEYKHEDTVTAYRNYYRGGKADIAKWKLGPPEWWFTGVTPKSAEG